MSRLKRRSSGLTKLCKKTEIQYAWWFFNMFQFHLWCLGVTIQITITSTMYSMVIFTPNFIEYFFWIHSIFHFVSRLTRSGVGLCHTSYIHIHTCYLSYHRLYQFFICLPSIWYGICNVTLPMLCKVFLSMKCDTSERYEKKIHQTSYTSYPTYWMYLTIGIICKHLPVRSNVYGYMLRSGSIFQLMCLLIHCINSTFIIFRF